MSYILEALKRAERERRAGSQSLLDEIPSVAPAPATAAWKRWVPAAILSALLSAVVVYFALVHFTRPQVASAPVAAPAIATTPSPAESAPAIALTSRPAMDEASQPSDGASAVQDDGHMATLDDLGADESAPLKPARTNDSDTPAPASPEPQSLKPSRVVAGRNLPTAPSPSAAGDNSGETIDGGVATTPENASPNVDSANAATSEMAKPSGPQSHPALKEMPDAYRSGFPDITIDIHAYSESPDQRFVLIGGKRFHEGDVLPQGPKIIGIVPEGIVFDWHGERVLYPLPH